MSGIADDTIRTSIIQMSTSNSDGDAASTAGAAPRPAAAPRPRRPRAAAPGSSTATASPPSCHLQRGPRVRGCGGQRRGGGRGGAGEAGTLTALGHVDVDGGGLGVGRAAGVVAGVARRRVADGERGLRARAGRGGHAHAARRVVVDHALVVVPEHVLRRHRALQHARASAAPGPDGANSRVDDLEVDRVTNPMRSAYGSVARETVDRLIERFIF